MKKFNELALNITESEYRNNGRFHYSDVAGYARNGFSYLLKQEKEETDSLTFGSMVDCIVTQGMDEFNRKYCVERQFGLSDNQKLVTQRLINTGFYDLANISPDTILSVLNEIGLYKNFKPETKVSKIIEECSEYYGFIVDNRDKIPVEFDMFNDAVEVANRLLTDNSTRSYFTGVYEGVDRFFQLKFDGDYCGIPITAMVDLVYVDHFMKTVYLVDLKTTCAGYEWEFPKSFLKWRYDHQAKIYSYVVRQNMDKDEFYKDYKLGGFIFIYISRDNKEPLLWTFERNLEREDIVIETKSGRKIILEDFVKPLMEMNEIKNQSRKYPLDVFKGDGNDILEHLKKL